MANIFVLSAINSCDVRELKKFHFETVLSYCWEKANIVNFKKIVSKIKVQKHNHFSKSLI